MKKLVSFLFAVFGVVQCCFAAVNATDIYLLAQTNNTSELSKIRNIDTTDLYGDTALCSAIRFNDIDTYNLLKNFGANTEHRCTKKIPREHYSSFIQKVAEANKSWTFLGMGKWAWGAIGVGVAGGAAAIAMSGGGGKNADNPQSSPSNTLDCVHGVQINNRCSCDNGWTGTLCDTLTTCPYSTTSCANGYIETGNTCQSGNTMYKECIPSTCPYSTTSCPAGYYETGETCKSGENTYVKCQANACEGYNYTDTNACPPGYTISDTCLSGNISKYKCETPATCSYTTTECTEGYSETGNTCKSGENLYKECVPSTCPYSTTSCGTGFYATGNSCLSGGTTYIECEFDSDNYINQEGTIYQKLNCVHGNQIANSCSCADGWTGDLCDTVSTCPYTTTSCSGGYMAAGTSCKSGDNVYVECKQIECGINATWTESGCICNTGYQNWIIGVGCSNTSINCGQNAHQKGPLCECNEGYENWVENSGCSMKVLNCGIHAHQVGAFCQCDIGFINWTDGYGCYQPLECGIHAYQNGNQCECEPGYINWTTTGCSPSTFSGVIVINNIDDDDVIAAEYSNVTINIDNTNANSNIYGTVSGANASGFGNESIHIKNNGNGNVYGIAKMGTTYGYSFNARTHNYSYEYPASISGNITINNIGNGDVYGMYREGILDTSGTNYFIANLMDESLYAYHAIDYTASINLNNVGDGNVFGMYGWYLFNAYAYDSYILPDYDSIGEISIVNDGIGNAYGMYVPNSNIAKNNMATNAKGATGIITLLNKNTGNAYGMFGDNITNLDSTISSIRNAEIHLTNYSNGSVFGMYGLNVSNNNTQTSTGQSIVDLQNLNSGKAIGLYANVNGNATNSGTVNINNIGTGIAIGVFGDMNSTITNTGIINITRNDYVDKDSVLHDVSGIAGDVFGIYAKSGSVVNNFGNITITSNGNAYGIYAESDSTVTNTGTISINGESCFGTDCNTGNYIVLNGSTLYNSGVIEASQMNLNSMGGNVVAGLGSHFVIDNELSGDLNISSELVQNGNQTTYVAENMIDAGDVSGLNVRSASAMFDASLADNGHDVVMQMKDFSELTDNKSLASFLANNYVNGNGADFFATLKSMDNMSAFGNALSGLTGLSSFTQFAHEDLSAMREISLSMNNKLFENSDNDSFDISDSMGYFSFSSDHNGGSGQYGITSSKVSDNWKLGYGMAFANINTVADNNDVGRQNTMWLFYMPAIYNNGDYELVVSPKAGFSYSDYNRRGYNNMNYDGRIEKRIFGLMNDLRYPVKFGNWTIAPDLGFNTIVYTQKGNENGQLFSLVIPEDETVSVETGLGLYTKYDKTFDNGGRLKLTSGLMAYREFGDTYNIKLGITGMDGTFDLYNNDYKYRGAASFGFDYAQGNLHLYGDVQYFMDNANYTNFKGGIRYRF